MIPKIIGYRIKKERGVIKVIECLEVKVKRLPVLEMIEVVLK